MTEYEKLFRSLNKSQLEAVRKLDGPLLVLAGPGTGKTTLLMMRIAHILKNTDTLPESILCLTFTESAQQTMQNRLVSLLGQEAYKVQVHTFHSFGAWVMRNYPQYFESKIGTQLADDITRYQIFLSIFESLKHYDPLAVTNEGDYIYLSDARDRISKLKQAAITPARLGDICQADSKWVEQAEKHISYDLGDLKTITKSAMSLFQKLCSSLEALAEMSEIGRLCFLELRDALNEAQSTDKVSTKPLTAWKNSWLVKKSDGSYGLKYTSQLKRLSSLAGVYASYQKQLTQKGLTDYDDQLMILLQGMQTQPDLLAELQERFLYLMADEYQDTNGVQQRILETLVDSPVANGRPNIMAVGDDDQAIYGFQGAYSSNLLDFLKRWRDVETITLTINYRSTPEIVNFSRTIIQQGGDRLENHYEYIDKELTTPNQSGTMVHLKSAGSTAEAYQALAESIQQDLKAGIAPEEITVLAPQHKYLERLVPYLSHYDIGVSYEKRQDILNEPHIKELLVLAEVVAALGSGRHKEANAKLPELLSYPWWGLSAEALMSVSLTAYEQKKLWIEAMGDSNDTVISQIAGWLTDQASLSLHTPLEYMLDILTGHSNDSRQNSGFVSPYYTYYFLRPESGQELHYLLSSLIVIRRHVRDYVGQSNLILKDFISYCELRRQSGLQIINDHPLASKAHSINLMTAHKAKGMEFQSVYILDSQHSVWAKPRGRSSLIQLPPHIAALPSGDSSDEYLRLFYVALTRAASKLTLIRTLHDEGNNPTLPIGWLQSDTTKKALQETSAGKMEPADITRSLVFDWHARATAFKDSKWRDRLQTRLENYRLSPTALSTFLDVTNGGPRTFLINNLLRFPAGTNPNIAFGNSMHALMQFMHNHVLEKSVMPEQKTAVNIFSENLIQYRLGEIETSKQLSRGEYAIGALYKQANNLFKDRGIISEVDMSGEEIILGTARVTGKIDLIDTDEHAIKDYKTGKPVTAWPKDGTKSYDALKMHRYRQQLLFYKLMAQRAASCKEYHFDRAELIFLEPGEHTNVQTLSFEYDSAELQRLESLIQAVWQKILNLELPDISNYPADVVGVRAFEEDLLNGN